MGDDQSMVTRTVEYDLDPDEIGIPVSFYVVNVGGHAKVVVPDESPLSSDSLSDVMYAMHVFLSDLSQVMSQQAAIASLEEDPN